MAKYNKQDFADTQKLGEALKLKPTFWKKMHEFVKKWIWADMRDGKLQGKIEHDYYRSETYKKYKANWGKRFTNRTGNTDTKSKANKGRAVLSNRTNAVDMLLTGQLIRGLHFVRSTPLGGVSSYDSKDIGKIEGNLKYGRDITTLNEANRQKMVKKVSKQLDENLKGWAGKVVINLGKK